MYKIDLKDRKILYQLDLDSRQSLTKIGKNVGLKKDIVSYRIKKLQDEGVIKSFWTLIDAYKLGYIIFRFYLVFQYVNQDIKYKIINYLVKNKRICVVNEIIGKYDLGIFLWLKDINEFYSFWEGLLDNYGDYFSEKIFSIYVKWFTYRNSYILLDEYNIDDRLNYEITGGQGKRIEVDDTDLQLLNDISINSRIPLIELADKLDCSSQMVSYRLNNLKKSGVIQAFRVGIDLSKLGLKEYKVDIQLKEHTKRKHIMEYIKSNPNLEFIGTSAGVSDLELEFVLENSDKLHQVMEDISSKYPGAIRKYEYFNTSVNHKLRFIPEL